MRNSGRVTRPIRVLPRAAPSARSSAAPTRRSRGDRPTTAALSALLRVARLISPFSRSVFMLVFFIVPNLLFGQREHYTINFRPVRKLPCQLFYAETSRTILANTRHRDQGSVSRKRQSCKPPFVTKQAIIECLFCHLDGVCPHCGRGLSPPRTESPPQTGSVPTADGATRRSRA